MKAAPARPSNCPESQPPARAPDSRARCASVRFARSTRRSKAMSLGSVESQYSSARPRPSATRSAAILAVADRRADHRDGRRECAERKARGDGSAEPSATDPAPGALRKASASSSSETGWCLASRRRRVSSPSTARPPLRSGQVPCQAATRRRRQMPGRGQVQRRDVGAQLAVIAIAAFSRTAPRGSRRPRRPSAVAQRNLRLGRNNLLRHMCLAPPRAVGRPLGRQIEPPSHRQARMPIGQRSDTAT